MTLPEPYIATISLNKIIGKTAFKIEKKELRAALDLSVRIEQQAKKTVAGEELSIKSNLTSKDIPGIKKAIVDLNLQALLTTLGPKLEEEGVGLEVAIKIVELLKVMQVYLPNSDPDDPLTSADTKLLWVARIVEDPLWVMNLVSNQQLTDFDVEALMQLYPEIYADISTALVEAAIEKYASAGKIPRKLKLGLSVLLQIPMLSLETIQAFEQGIEDDKLQQKIDKAQMQVKADLDIAKQEQGVK